MSVQTSYSTNTAVAYNGQLADLNPKEVVSKLAQVSAISPGVVVSRGTADNQCKAGAVATSATKTTGAAPFTMTAGMTVVVDVDNAGDATATWDAAAGYVDDTTTYPVTDQDGLNVTIAFNGGATQTVTFSGAHTTALQIAASINAQISGGYATVTGGQVRVVSDQKGTGSSVVAGAGTSGITWDTAVAGTGDVANIAAVTAAEVKTVIEADTTATCTVNAAGTVTISSPTTGTTSELDFDATSTALTALGLSAEVLTGTAASTPVGLALRYIATEGTGTSNAISYAVGEALPVLRDGYAFITLAGTGVPGASLYMTNATGAVGIGTAGAGQTQLTNWTLESTVSTTGTIGLVRVRQ